MSDLDLDLELEQRLESKASSLGHIMSYFGPTDGGEFRQSSCIICAKSVRYALDDPVSAAGGAIEIPCAKRGGSGSRSR